MGLVRFILAVSVVVFHFQGPEWLKFVYGFDAVPLFYIISGFYMSLILNGKYNSYYTFITNRFLKIFPTYLLVLAVGTVASFSLYSDILHQTDWRWTDKVYLIFANTFIFGSELIWIMTKSLEGLRFIGLSEPQNMGFGKLAVIGPVWSLSVELTFYLMAPFLLKSNRRSFCLLLVFTAIGIAYSYFISSQQIAQIPWNYNLFPASMKFFALGALSYHIYFFYLGKKQLLGKLSTAFELSICALLIASMIFYHSLPEGPVFGLSITHLMVAAAILVTAIGIVFERTKNWRIDRFLGDLSYPVYISHWLFIEHILLPIHPLIPTLGISVVLLIGIIYPVNSIRQRRLIKTETAR